MRAVDFEATAALLAERGRVRPGDQVLIFAHDAGFPLADALLVATYRKGGVPAVLVLREEAEVAAFAAARAEDVARTPAHVVAAIAASDVIFILYAQYKNPALSRSVTAEKLTAHMRAQDARRNTLYDGRRRVIITDVPTPAQAAFFGVPFERYHDAFWAAMEVDYGALEERVNRVAAFLAGRQEVHIRTAKGTDVRLRIGGRRVYADAGWVPMPGEDDEPILNLPTGEAYLAPAEDGATGVVVFDFAFIAGERVENLRVRFEGGRATLEGAARGFERAAAYFASGTGDPYRIAELGVGVNAALTEPFGSILMDEKIGGTVHLALGDNRPMGGANASSIHMDMILLAPEVSCDGELLMAGGKLHV
jgi:aminopeptidase